MVYYRNYLPYYTTFINLVLYHLEKEILSGKSVGILTVNCVLRFRFITVGGHLKPKRAYWSWSYLFFVEHPIQIKTRLYTG